MTSDYPPAAVMQALGLHECAPDLIREWENSGRTFERPPFFLNAAFIEDVASKCGIGPSEREHILRAATTILGNEALVRLVWHQHHLLFASSPVSDVNAVMLPEYVQALGHTHTYNLLLAFSGLPSAERVLSRYPRDVLKGVYADIGTWCTHFRKNVGLCGISSRILVWEHGLMQGAYYRIGRLQFNIRPFHPNYHVYRNRASRVVRALVRSGVGINADGQLDGVDGRHDAQAWTTTFEQDAARVAGYLLSPRGFVMRDRVTLELSEWEKVLAPGDPVLDVHVPAVGPLDIDRCADSFHKAVVFFHTYFPEKTFHGFSCCAWFLDVQYEKLLPPTSNILRFQRAMYLYPIRAGVGESLVRIFGEKGLQSGLAKAPRTNSLQRAVAAHLDAGGHLRSGGGFFLVDDLPFGRPVYRLSAPA
jgi:hypothetical protein